jgi:Tol biopolymer transport system component
LLADYYGRETNFTRNQIVEISYPGGKARTITHDVSNYGNLDLSANGLMVATVQSLERYDLFVTNTSNLGDSQVQQLTSGTRVYNLAWTPDGQLILDQVTLNLLDPATGTNSPLASTLPTAGSAWMPCSCANGRYVVFSRVAQGGAKTTTIWRMDASGANLKQLSDGKEDERAVCSPDGKWVYYSDISNGGKLSRVPIDGGEPEKLTELPAYAPFDVSPDGKLVAFTTSGNHKKELALLPVDSPKDTKFGICSGQSQPIIRSASALMAKLWLIRFVSRTRITSGSSLSTVRRESRSPTSNRNTSRTFTGLSTAASWG